MQICQNPNCSNPFNLRGNRFCTSCGGSNFGNLFKNRYCVQRLIGEGGFGKTYEAQDVDRLDAPCVIKQFVPQVRGTAAFSKATSMFKEEARRLFELGENHTQIPRLVSYFEQGENLYVVQEFIAGETLLEELQHHAFTEEEIEELLRDLLPVLQFIHDRNVIHRDLKPQNIIRRQSDRKLVLIDFGGAKQVTQTTLARQGTGIYTIGYAPLEQMQGYACPASDLYALGATCVRLLTRSLPLSDTYGNLTDPLYDVRNARWTWRERLSEKGLTVSDRLGQTFDKLLGHVVEQRFQSAQEVLQELDSTASAVPPTIPMRVRTQSRATAETYNFWGLDKFHRQDYQGAITDFTQALQINPRYVEALTNRGHVCVQMGNYDSAFADYNQALNLNPNFTEAIQGRDKIQAQRQVTQVSIPARLKNASLAFVLTGHKNLIKSLAFGSNSDTLYSGGNDKSVRIWDLQKHQQQGFLAESGDWVTVVIARNGQIGASSSSNKTIKVWHLANGSLQHTLRGHSDLITSLCISPDGQTLVSSSRDKTIGIWQLNNGKLIRKITGHAGHIYTVSFSKDGQFLASGGSDKTIKIWQPNTGKLLRTIPDSPGFIRAIAISSQLRLIASAGFGSTIYLWNLHTGQLQKRLEGHQGSIQTLAITDDGQTLISGGDDATIKLWNLHSGKMLHFLSGHTRRIWAIAVSPDGQFFASGGEDKTIRIWHTS